MKQQDKTREEELKNKRQTIPPIIFSLNTDNKQEIDEFRKKLIDVQKQGIAEGKRIQEAKDDIIIKKSCILVRDNTIAEVEKIVRDAKQKNPTEILAISMLVYNQLIDRLILAKLGDLK